MPFLYNLSLAIDLGISGVVSMIQEIIDSAWNDPDLWFDADAWED